MAVSHSLSFDDRRPLARALVTSRPMREYHESNGSPYSDAALVRATLDGDASAFTVLVDRHQRVCLRFATRMLGSVEDAEDVTQDALVRAYRALGRFDGTMEFRTWLISILLNRCRTLLRVRGRWAAVVVEDERIALATAARDAGDQALLREAIDRALAQLPSALREAFLLKHVEQLSYEEMQTVTGAGLSALKMRVRRACERLQVLLQEERHA